MFRGSKKHVLDWTSRPTFPIEFMQLLRPLNLRLDADAYWMPRGYAFPHEARLDTFGPRVFPNHPAWPQLAAWWLPPGMRGNTPNWDIALRGEIEGQAGLVLVEAKANEEELSAEDSKSGSAGRSAQSVKNDEHIRNAIEQAKTALQKTMPGISISCATHYQLSNRVAFAWKLATLGIPTVVLYLGFTGDEGIADAGRPFVDEADWLCVFNDKCRKVWSGTMTSPILTDKAPFWLIARSRQAIESSPPSKAL
ncbi:MAG TPA: hypothetical protein VJ840_17930 [Gemmatimonadaceae bacterium]|nr:hypothetical protein [Gemmatimonadaceae bacterium]